LVKYFYNNKLNQIFRDPASKTWMHNQDTHFQSLFKVSKAQRALDVGKLDLLQMNNKEEPLIGMLIKM
jgi:hypothetical protein